MPYLYDVERKINAKIIIVALAGIIIIAVLSYLFISNYIERKRIRYIYDYIALEDYDNASFIFKDLYSKKPLNKNILMAGIDLYYNILLITTDKDIITTASENITKYAKQMLLTSKFIKNKYIIYQRLAYGFQRLGSSYYIDSYNSYLEAIKNGDNRVSTVIELAKICYRIGYYEEAIENLEYAIKRDTENNKEFLNLELYYELAVAYEGNKNYTKAIQILSYIDGKFNNDYKLEAKSYSKLGDLYYRQGLYKESEFFYKKALLLDDKNPDLYYSIGELFRKTKRINEAIAMFREALKIDNNYKPARDALRRL